MKGKNTNTFFAEDAVSGLSLSVDVLARQIDSQILSWPEKVSLPDDALDSPLETALNGKNEVQDRVVEDFKEALHELSDLIKPQKEYKFSRNGTSLGECLIFQKPIGDVNASIAAIDKKYQQVKELYDKIDPRVKNMDLKVRVGSMRSAGTLSTLFDKIDSELKPASKFRRLLQTVVKALTLGQRTWKQSTIDMAKDRAKQLHREAQNRSKKQKQSKSRFE